MKAKNINRALIAKYAFWVLFIAGFFNFNMSYAQEADSDHNEVFTSVEHTPEFPGGMNEFFKYVSTNIKYPAEAREKKMEGKVIATFIVEKDGALSNVKILRSSDESFATEAVRVVSASPKWKPGTQNGKMVRVQYTVPIVFSLDGKMLKPSGQNKLTSKMPNAYYVIDGKPATSEQVTSLDVNKVQSVNVLKDTMATDKYGDNGKNGVIEIITKQN
ncbi:energy transducer TonB [Mucilaginibacter lacusdianchii]|uniref:energy transducer TonB n=1 Tax=Mucilaginibacter lacusdianchii TaxID=2684211 RepID=UPI00131D7D60|nr:energy transducer TonB [Mucilaginibacter sp. JXJ CY 39]